MASRAILHGAGVDPPALIAVAELESVLDGDHFAAFVEAAFRADSVRKLGLVALRAGRQRLLLEEVVRAARTRAGLRMASFWIRHCLSPFRYRLPVTGCQS